MTNWHLGKEGTVIKSIILSPKVKGYTMIILAAAMWGFSGTVAQHLFQQGVQPGSLVTIRMLGAGLLLLLVGLKQKRHPIWSIWKSSTARIQVVIFGLLGILGSQYTFFKAIDKGNAAAAALLQYLGPLFIMIYVAMRLRKLPSAKEFLALFLALMGTSFLVTDGSFTSLNIPFIAVFWGLTSAITLAIYTLYPVKLLAEWGSINIVGWGMLIGGVALSFIHPPWEIVGQITSASIGFFVIYIVVFGTLVPYYLFIDSLRFVRPAEASIIACAEPLAAVIASIVWLNVPFGYIQSIGGLAIMIAVILLALKPKEAPVKVQGVVDAATQIVHKKV